MSAARWALALAVAAAAWGCAAGTTRVQPAAGAARVGMAMLPLENLSGRAENGDRYSRLVWTVLGRTDRFVLTDPGEVEAALGELRIRSSGSIARDQVVRAAQRLGTRWLVTGTLLEAGLVRTPDGDCPSFGLTLRVLDGRTGNVVWSDLATRSCQDRETIFGWGREENLERLADAATRELVEKLRLPEPADSLTTREGKP